MPSRRSWLLRTLAVLVLLLAAAGGVFYWFRYGPGFEGETERLAVLVDPHPGMTVADVGAGKGRIAVPVARRLGPSGRLYATEIEASKLEAIREAAADAVLDNITTLEAGRGSTNAILPPPRDRAGHGCGPDHRRRLHPGAPDRRLVVDRLLPCIPQAMTARTLAAPSPLPFRLSKRPPKH